MSKQLVVTYMCPYMFCTLAQQRDYYTRHIAGCRPVADARQFSVRPPVWGNLRVECRTHMCPCQRFGTLQRRAQCMLRLTGNAFYLSLIHI